ncbi:proprotein convertase P-domain-containing protein [Dokdonella sp.]|uniref:proprotein convertase P-domain-containing protein n=1 Tax=Dokdonella sp. TaxID=2291710 RepID=UPI002CA207CA|nr:proprotein convertase P-domain-containing protein [Dokdonella sp.]HOX72918.1 proprotein convertase P-domain-containing protein [Dokdonella sp.]HPN80593.1 proprotein convertase P-domain-containing protein [Dokdonella sp.]
MLKMSPFVSVPISMALAMVASGAFAQSSLTRALTELPKPQRPLVQPLGAACGSITLTQSNSQAITALNSVSCNSGGLHTDNSYFRSFPLTADINVCEVQFGIETATGAGGTQPVTVNLYTGTGAFPGTFPGSYTQIGTANISVPDQAATIFPASVNGLATAGSNLVVEVFTPDGQTAGNSFFFGTNAAGETAPSYLQAATCGVTTPTTTAAIGFPNMQLVMNVVGNPGGPTLTVGSAQASLADQCASNPGQANGVIEPGETVTVQVPISAAGGSFTGVVASLGLPAPAGITYVTSSSAIGALADGSSATATFVVTANDTASCVTGFSLPVNVTSNEGNTASGSIASQIGESGNIAPNETLPVAIPDNAGPATSTISVTQDISLTDLSVAVAIDHTWMGDVTITLTSPGGTTVTLLDRPGVPASTFGCGDNNMDVVFSDSASVNPETTCNAATPWLSGPVLPASPLSAFAGQSTIGTWTLSVSDGAAGDTGGITDWGLIPTPGLQGTCTVCAAGGGGPVTPEIELPTLATWSKLALALFALALGVVGIRRRMRQM